MTLRLDIQWKGSSNGLYMDRACTKRSKSNSQKVMWPGWTLIFILSMTVMAGSNIFT